LELATLQRAGIWDFVKSAGAAVLQGKELTNVAIPVVFFQKKTYFERICQSWSHIDFINNAKGNL
jgi:hypothetical protein